MSELTIGLIVGSVRQASTNLRLAKALVALAPGQVQAKFIRIDDLPLYNPDTETEAGPAVTRLRQEIASCDGIVFVTPEYNRSLPAALKNAIDHASRPYGKSAWAGKPAGVIGASPGAAGTAMAQQHLRNVLAFLDMPTMGQPEAFIQTDAEFFAADGSVAREKNREFLAAWIGKFAAWATTQRQ